MNDQPSAYRCSQCGATLAPDAPEGLCPRCLLQLHLRPPTGEVGPGGTQVMAPDPRTPPGIAEIAPHFPQLEILECLGRGGMGVVYKARQPLLDRLVALKILTRDKENDAHFAERFQREARALARLNHPNIVTVYDFGESGGLFYLLMELVDGTNLRQLLQTTTLTPTQALAIVPPICEALQFAHTQGIVHRDIKPENILVDKQGRVKIADFGIAKILGEAAGREPLTGQQQVMGTPHYMAPEQVEKPASVDHRADIYSLGVVFYEMLTGELPLGRFALPSELVRLDLRLDEVVMRALEKEPDRRYQQASQVRSRVETIASGPGEARSAVPPAAPEPPPVSPPPVEPTGSRFSRLVAITAAYEAVALWGSLFVGISLLFRPNPWVGRPWILMGVMLLLAPGVIGTAAGLVGLIRVQRSRGRLRGAGLALAETMVFPLLGLDIALGLLLYALLRRIFGPQGAGVIAPVLALVFGALVDAALAFVLWRWLRSRLPGPGGASFVQAAGPAESGPTRGNLGRVIAAVVGILLLLGTLLIGLVVLSFVGIRRENGPELSSIQQIPNPEFVSPTMEFQISPVAAPENNFFDLANGRFVTPPDAVIRFLGQTPNWRELLGEAVGSRPEVDRVRDLLRQCGANLIVESSNTVCLLDGVAITRKGGGGRDLFGTEDSQAIAQVIDECAPPLGVIKLPLATLLVDPVRNGGSQGWFFCTSAGLRGIMEFTDVDPNTGAVSFRYRRLPDSPASQ